MFFDGITINGRLRSLTEFAVLNTTTAVGICLGMAFYLSNSQKLYEQLVKHYAVLQEVPDTVEAGLDFIICSLYTVPLTLSLVTLAFLAEVGVDSYRRRKSVL